MADITDLRTKINQVDTELVKLLNDRAQLAQQIGKIKTKTGAAVYDPDRERDVLDRGERGDEVERREHEADALASEHRELAIVQL